MSNGTRDTAVNLWEKYGHDAAWAEGWDLFVRGGDVDGELEIEYNQNPEDWPEGETEAAFNGDDEVIAQCISRHERHHLLALYLEGRPANQDTWMPPELMPIPQSEIERDKYYLAIADVKIDEEDSVGDIVSRNDEENGAYVQTWTWVRNEDTDLHTGSDPAGLYSPNDAHVITMARDLLNEMGNEDVRDAIDELTDVEVMFSRLDNDEYLPPYRTTAEDIIRYLGPYQIRDSRNGSEKGFEVASDMVFMFFSHKADAEQTLKFCEALAKLDRPNTIAKALEEEKRNEAEG